MSTQPRQSVEHADSTQVQAAPSVSQAPVPVDSAAHEAVAAMGNVAENSENAAQNMSGQQGDDNGGTQQASDDQLTDREALRARLLKHAPKTPAMRAQVRRKLERERDNLESDVRKFRRRKDFHKLSMAIMKLREVIRQLETLAQMSLERLQQMWLEVVHKFA